MPKTAVINSGKETPEQVAARISKYIAEKYPDVSPAKALAMLSKAERMVWLGQLNAAEQDALYYDWNFWARPDQRFPKGAWRNWIIRAGRGWGKTRTAAEWVRHKIVSGQCRHIALIGPSANDVRKVMVEDIRTFGSGIMQICPKNDLPQYIPTYRTLYWSKFNASCSLYTGEEPELLRGPAHDGAWIDEIMRMRKQDAVWDMLQMGLRGVSGAQVVVTTTPKSTDLMRRLVRMPNTVVTVGSTFDNDILPKDYLDTLTRDYSGTRLGQQELYGAILDDIEGSLWRKEYIENFRLHINPETGKYDGLPTLHQTIIAVDPQTGGKIGDYESSRRISMTGIVVAGIDTPVRGQRRHAYILADESMNGYPEEWGKKVVSLYRQYGASLIVCEGNQGGKMIEYVLRSIDPSVRIKIVTAITKKHERAQPVVSKYEQGCVHHVGVFADLEREMLTYEPGDEDKKKSPNRMDALVWAVRHLLLDGVRAGAGIAIGRRI